MAGTHDIYASVIIEVDAGMWSNMEGRGVNRAGDRLASYGLRKCIGVCAISRTRVIDCRGEFDSEAIADSPDRRKGEVSRIIWVP
jgi:hypothetical protein